MGNPLSPLLAEIFMDNLERKIRKQPFFKNVIFWYRYVDDIFCAIRGTNRQIDKFLEFLNKLHPNIEFTVEFENNSSINFLDLTISRDNNGLVFDIFHKPTHTDTTIHNTSLHPYSQKLASFYTYIHRLINLPLSKENFEKELNLIKQIAVNNGYDPSLIDSILHKKQYKKCISSIYPTFPTTNKRFQVLTFIGEPSLDITKLLSKFDLNIAFKTCNNLSNFIKNNKSKLRDDQKSGVYKLECGSCDKVYIGQTGRTFRRRMYEHFRSYLNQDGESNYANHLIDYNHVFNNKYKILHQENKGMILNLLETLEINRLKNCDVLLNNQLDLNNSPLLNLKS